MVKNDYLKDFEDYLDSVNFLLEHGFDRDTIKGMKLSEIQDKIKELKGVN